MRKTTIAIALIALFFNCSTGKKKDNQIITLSNGTITIKLLPAVGGRLVSASLSGYENILNSDSAQWNEAPEKRPTMDPAQPFKAYNGMIVWLSPQSEWWIKQDLYPELKKTRSLWPPDPYLTCSEYRITNQTASEITMVSSESPNTHVQFSKTFRIEGNKVFIKAKAKNCSKDTVSWGLWFNTRMNGWDKVFVPADSSDLVKCLYLKYPDIHKPALKYADGCFSYEPVEPETGQVAYKSKSFISVENPVIMGYKANQWLIIRSNRIDRAWIHPQQARVELYIENSASKANDLQELEMHFAYEKIAPGATIEASQTWEIAPGSDQQNKNEVLKELKVKRK
jgi:hypothetical protein